jgi:galactan endo-1,6-beta-galactosidase
MFNEPVSDWWVYGGTQEGCMIDINTQQAIVPLTAAALAVSGSSTIVAASDDNDIDQSYYSMLAFISSGNLDHISQINTHTYSGTLRKELQQLAAQYNKKLWVSEYGDGDGSGLTLAQQLMTDLAGLQPLVWCYWQAVDMTGSGWGPLEAELNTPGSFEFQVTPKYYVFSQFTKYLRPGYTFVETNNTNTVAAESGDSLAIVSINCGTNSIEVPSNFNRVASAHLTVPWDNIYYEDVTSSYSIQNSYLQFTLPQGGVISFSLE